MTRHNLANFYECAFSVEGDKLVMAAPNARVLSLYQAEVIAISIWLARAIDSGCKTLDKEVLKVGRREFVYKTEIQGCLPQTFLSSLLKDVTVPVVTRTFDGVKYYSFEDSHVAIYEGENKIFTTVNYFRIVEPTKEELVCSVANDAAEMRMEDATSELSGLNDIPRIVERVLEVGDNFKLLPLVASEETEQESSFIKINLTAAQAVDRFFEAL